MEAFLFYTFSGLAILGALLVVFVQRPTRSLLSLIVMMVALTVLYIQLGAHFVAIAQIIVYAGAVLVLFLFVIMLQGLEARDVKFKERFSIPLLVAFLGISLLLGLFLSCVYVHSHVGVFQGVYGSVKNVGLSLFKEFLLPFELTAVLLLLSVFAAVALAKQDSEEKAIS
jgi:NADH-quinone oxidoreductase subunit J